MRILELGSTAYDGGVSVAVKTLVTSLCTAGNQVTLVCNGGQLDEVTEAGAQVVTFEDDHRLMRLPRQALKLRGLLNSFQPDIVHAHGRGYSLLCHVAGRRPDFFTLHNTHFTHQYLRFDVGLARRLLSPLGHRVFVLNDIAQRYVRQEFGIKDEHILQVSNGVDCDRFSPPSATERTEARTRFSVENEQTLVLFVGRLHPSKQPGHVVELAALCRQKGLHNVRFAIVGEGELRAALEQQVKERGLARTCSFHGWTDPVDAYRAADLLVMPSLFEGFGLVAVEGMACGLPVVRSRSGGEEGMIIEGKNGQLCGVDIESFTDTALSLLEDPQKLNSMRPFAREWAVRHFSAAHRAEQISRLFHAYLQSTIEGHRQ